MRLLVTGSSGWLGRTLVPRLRLYGHHVVGLDAVPGPDTAIVGSVTDRLLIDRTLAFEPFDGVVHAAALHKPDIARRPAGDFVAVNVQGTLNLLEAAAAAGIGRFVFTSTTSLMIGSALHAGGGGRATWIDEEFAPLRPRNIYGVTKLAAEHLCRMTFEQSAMPIVILRTGRFFPEADDMAHAIPHSDANTKANELLFRRLTVEDAAEAHVTAIKKAPIIGFTTVIVAAPTPFRPEDCAELIRDAPSVVARYFPNYPDLYRRRGWSMFASIDRVYSAAQSRQSWAFAAGRVLPRYSAALEDAENINGRTWAR